MLRIALERSSTLVPRLQLTVTRFQMQQDRVERLSRDLATLRAQLVTDSFSKEHMTASLRQFEEKATQTQDPALKTQLEDAANSMKSELEQQALREQQWRSQESEQSGQLRAEQAKLNDLSQQLDQLDRQMQTP